MTLHFQFNQTGMELVAQGEFQAAIEHFERAIELADQADYQANLGLAFLLAGKPSEAVTALHRASGHRPLLPVVWGYLGAAYCALEDYDNAMQYLHRALYEPSQFVLRHLSLVNHRLGRFYEAQFYTEALLSLNPADKPAHFNRGILLLTGGDYQTGFEEFRYRTAMVEVCGRDVPREYGIPNAVSWNGEDIAGRHLLVVAEAGFGDSVQFCRFIPDLAQRCRKLSVYERPSLRPLLRLAFPTIDICDQVPADVDFYMLAMEAGRLLRLNPGVVDRGAYLRVVPRAHLWQDRLAHLPTPRVGLVWAGASANPMDARRSLSLDQLAPLLRIPVGWVSLQMERDGVCPMFDAAPFIHDWLDTAAAIDALDLVIAVDTAVAHVAGAMGKPVWLLNRKDTCWRWGISGERTPWYASMRIFRQSAVGDWLPVIAQVAASLRQQTPL